MQLTCATRCSRSLLIGALVLWRVPALAGWQETPDSLQLQAVGNEVALNGTPMVVRQFSASQSMEDLLKQVQDAWQRTGGERGEVSRSKAASWTVLNQRIGQAHRSFQIRETSPQGVEGYVALTSPDKARDPKVAVALPADFKAVSIIDSRDQGRVSQQLVVTSPRSVDASLNALESILKAGGWSRLALDKSADSIRFAANRGAQEVDAMLQKQKNGSLLMMNIVTQTK